MRLTIKQIPMKKLLLFSMLILLSCNKEDLPGPEQEMEETSQDCGIINPIGFSATPMDRSVLLQFGSIGHWDGPFISCAPEAFNVYMSEDGADFNRITKIEEGAGSHLVENLKNDEIYYFRVTALHSQLDSFVSEIREVKVGLLPSPKFIDNPLSVDFEFFSLSPDGDKFLYRNSADDWYVSSFSNPGRKDKVVDDSFSTKWNPHNDSEVLYRKKQYVQISTNTNGITSKGLVSVSLENGTEDVLHDISDYMDFGSELKPEKYWIHDFDYSLDATSIYCMSNKDNGSTSLRDKKVFDNIWKLDLATKELIQISDFLPMNFEIKYFVEDPRSPNNFYVIGGIDGEVEEIEGAIFNVDKVDIYYYNTADQSLNLVLETIYEEETIHINPSGDKLLFINSKSGREELWSYDLMSKQLNQVTQSSTYRPSKGRYYPSWVSDTEIMVSLYHEDDLMLAIFKI